MRLWPFARKRRPSGPPSVPDAVQVLHEHVVELQKATGMLRRELIAGQARVDRGTVSHGRSVGR